MEGEASGGGKCLDDTLSITYINTTDTGVLKPAMLNNKLPNNLCDQVNSSVCHSEHYPMRFSGETGGHSFLLCWVSVSNQHICIYRNQSTAPYWIHTQKQDVTIASLTVETQRLRLSAGERKQAVNFLIADT